jgi:hypothetical protein
MSAKLILESLGEHGIELLGAVHVDPSQQAHTPEAYNAGLFKVNWEAHAAVCPEGQTSNPFASTRHSRFTPLLASA